MAETYNITVYNNDTYAGVAFTITVNSVALDLTGATIQMQVRASRDSSPVIDISNASGITITDATAGKFEIDEQIFSIQIPGAYIYDIQITLASGEVKTYILGSFTVTGDITHV